MGTSTSTTQFCTAPDAVRPGDRVYVGVRNREPEWCVVTLPANGGVWVLVPGTDHDVARVDAPTFVVERDDEPADTETSRLIGTWFPQVGTRIRRNSREEFRRITEIEEFAQVRRCWFDDGEYIDLERRSTVFVPQADDGSPMD